MKKQKVKEKEADNIVEDFFTNVCYGRRKVKFTKCDFNKECGNSGVCLVKYMLRNYDVYKK